MIDFKEMIKSIFGGTSVTVNNTQVNNNSNQPHPIEPKIVNNREAKNQEFDDVDNTAKLKSQNISEAISLLEKYSCKARLLIESKVLIGVKISFDENRLGLKLIKTGWYHQSDFPRFLPNILILTFEAHDFYYYLLIDLTEHSNSQLYNFDYSLLQPVPNQCLNDLLLCHSADHYSELLKSFPQNYAILTKYESEFDKALSELEKQKKESQGLQQEESKS